MEIRSDSPLALAIAQATRAAWAQLQEEFGHQTFYGFALYYGAGGSYVTCTSWTEEGLAEVVERYGDGSTSDSLRFSGADSPFHEVGGNSFDELVDPLLQDSEGEVAWFEACFSALHLVDEEGLFAKVDRDRFILNVIAGDQSDNSIVENARRLNPPSTLAWFEPFFEVTSDEEVLAPVGERKVYLARDIARNADLIVIGDDERWLHTISFSEPETFTPVGRKRLSLRPLSAAISPAHNELWVAAEHELQRLSIAGTSLGEPVTVYSRAEGDYVGSVAIAPSGDTVALTSERQIVVLSRDGTELWDSTTGLRPVCAWDPAGERLLCVDESGVYWFDSSGSFSELIDPRPDGHSCAVSPDGRRVAVGFGSGYSDTAKFEIRVFDVASREVVWVAQYQGVRSLGPLAFNPSGTRLAVGMRGEAHVFNTHGALEFVGRSKLESSSAIEWLDNNLFVVAGCDVDTGPPARAFRVTE